MTRAGKPLVLLSLVLLTALMQPLWAAETCYTGSDIDPATRTAIESVARQIFDYASRGDVFSLRQTAVASLQSSFGSIEGLVIDQKPAYAGAQATLRETYLLEAPGAAAIQRAEFFCGVWMTPAFASFAINNLPPGRYAIVMQNVSGPKGPYALTTVLKQEAGGWKLAGYYSKPTQIGGHDADWFLTQAREFKTKGEAHSAWFYYLTAWDLTAPVDFMTTQKRDRLSDEMQAVRPTDLPSNSAVDLAAGGKTWKVTNIFADRGDNGLVLVVKYQSPDISDTQKTFADNMAVIKAIVNRYPEYRDAFSAVVARAVGPSGEYASLLPMKDVK